MRLPSLLVVALLFHQCQSLYIDRQNLYSSSPPAPDADGLEEQPVEKRRLSTFDVKWDVAGVLAATALSAAGPRHRHTIRDDEEQKLAMMRLLTLQAAEDKHIQKRGIKSHKDMAWIAAGSLAITGLMAASWKQEHRRMQDDHEQKQAMTRYLNQKAAADTHLMKRETNKDLKWISAGTLAFTGLYALCYKQRHRILNDDHEQKQAMTRYLNAKADQEQHFQKRGLLNRTEKKWVGAGTLAFTGLVALSWKQQHRIRKDDHEQKEAMTRYLNMKAAQLRRKHAAQGSGDTGEGGLMAGLLGRDIVKGEKGDESAMIKRALAREADESNLKKRGRGSKMMEGMKAKAKTPEGKAIIVGGTLLKVAASYATYKWYRSHQESKKKAAAVLKMKGGSMAASGSTPTASIRQARPTTSIDDEESNTTPVMTT